MKANEPGDHEEALRRVLKEWRVGAALPPHFQEGVWRRIEQAERAPAPIAPSAWAVIAHWIGTMLPRPALAASYVAILLAIGATAGWAQAHQETRRVKNELGERYVRVLDPYQTPRQ
jgi:protein-S-isoprenylcysteine O-methyltransferase Ste14